MNVGHPSNLARLIAVYGGNMDEKGHLRRKPDMDRLRRDIFAVSVREAETRNAIRSAYEQHRLLLEPHGAVGWAGLQKYLAAEAPASDLPCIALETAHPAKFPEEIRSILGFDPPLPPSLQGIEDGKESLTAMANDYRKFKEFLKKNYS
jgi:threonine synthase